MNRCKIYRKGISYFVNKTFEQFNKQLFYNNAYCSNMFFFLRKKGKEKKLILIINVLLILVSYMKYLC